MTFISKVTPRNDAEKGTYVCEPMKNESDKSSEYRVSFGNELQDRNEREDS